MEELGAFSSANPSPLICSIGDLQFLLNFILTPEEIKASMNVKTTEAECEAGHRGHLYPTPMDMKPKHNTKAYVTLQDTISNPAILLITLRQLQGLTCPMASITFCFTKN